MLGTSIINATATGNRFNQHKSINWSYLKRGRVALNRTNKKQNRQVFSPNTIDWIFKTVLFTNNSGILYPPKNSIEDIQLNSTIELYSPRKKKTNGTALYSVINPDTNSDSASWRSKGVLDVSAKTDMK